MSIFTPGQVVTTFTDKQGRELTVRFPKWEDLDQQTDFINKLSQEQTFIRFSGETISKEGEMSWLGQTFQDIESQDVVFLSAFDGETLVGNADVRRVKSNKARSLHVGEFGICLAQEYRSQGIGKKLAEIVLAEAAKCLPNLKMYTLSVYSPNELAISLYKSLGFTEVGRLPEYILHKGEYVDELVMVRSIRKE